MPSRSSPHFSRTRADAKFSASHVAARRRTEGTEKIHATIARAASVAYPLPQNLRANKKPNSAVWPEIVLATAPIARSPGGKVTTQWNSSPEFHSASRERKRSVTDSIDALIGQSA